MTKCSQNKSESKTKDDLFKEKILFKKVDDKGRVLKKVVTGRIPGEDIFLTLTQFDTAGREITEYDGVYSGKRRVPEAGLG